MSDLYLQQPMPSGDEEEAKDETAMPAEEEGMSEEE